MDPTINLLQGINRGDTSGFLKGDHVISRGDEQKTKAKVYMAVFGLQAFRKSPHKDKKQLDDYVSILASESNFTKLSELLLFFVSKKGFISFSTI